jgi:hypothetical protein
MSSTPWGDYPTWLSAVGTIAAVLVALWFSGAETRRANRAERMRQPEQVTAWVHPDDVAGAAPFMRVIVRNASNQSVYQLVASLVSWQGAFRKTAVGDHRPRYQSVIGQAPPGETEVKISSSGGGMHLRFGVELAFRDAAGRYWLRDGEGGLKAIDKDPITLYEIRRPVE